MNIILIICNMYDVQLCKHRIIYDIIGYTEQIIAELQEQGVILAQLVLR